MGKLQCERDHQSEVQRFFLIQQDTVLVPFAAFRNGFVGNCLSWTIAAISDLLEPVSITYSRSEMGSKINYTLSETVLQNATSIRLELLLELDVFF